jgi:cell division topological specificity factor
MSVLDYLFRKQRILAPKNTASLAKERLQIVVSHQSRRGSPDYLNQLQQELIQVIAKYASVDHEQIKIEIERSGNCSILELNVTLPNVAVE